MNLIVKLLIVKVAFWSFRKLIRFIKNKRRIKRNKDYQMKHFGNVREA